MASTNVPKQFAFRAASLELEQEFRQQYDYLRALAEEGRTSPDLPRETQCRIQILFEKHLRQAKETMKG